MFERGFWWYRTLINKATQIKRDKSDSQNLTKIFCLEIRSQNWT